MAVSGPLAAATGAHAAAASREDAAFALDRRQAALFVLGLGLGWLAVWTRGLLVPVLVHGLFNGVSVLFVLRGAT